LRIAAGTWPIYARAAVATKFGKVDVKSVQPMRREQEAGRIDRSARIDVKEDVATERLTACAASAVEAFAAIAAVAVGANDDVSQSNRSADLQISGSTGSVAASAPGRAITTVPAFPARAKEHIAGAKPSPIAVTASVERTACDDL
jgi:hypothetical protein